MLPQSGDQATCATAAACFPAVRVAVEAFRPSFLLPIDRRVCRIFSSIVTRSIVNNHPPLAKPSSPHRQQQHRPLHPFQPYPAEFGLEIAVSETSFNPEPTIIPEKNQLFHFVLNVTFVFRLRAVSYYIVPQPHSTHNCLRDFKNTPASQTTAAILDYQQRLRGPREADSDSHPQPEPNHASCIRQPTKKPPTPLALPRSLPFHDRSRFRASARKTHQHERHPTARQITPPKSIIRTITMVDHVKTTTNSFPTNHTTLHLWRTAKRTHEVRAGAALFFLFFFPLPLPSVRLSVRSQPSIRSSNPSASPSPSITSPRHTQEHLPDNDFHLSHVTSLMLCDEIINPMLFMNSHHDIVSCPCHQKYLNQPKISQPLLPLPRLWTVSQKTPLRRHNLLPATMAQNRYTRYTRFVQTMASQDKHNTRRHLSTVIAPTLLHGTLHVAMLP